MASKTEEKELIQQVEVMRDECQEKLRKIAEESLGEVRFEQIEEIGKLLQEKIREAEALLCDAVAMIPVGDRDELPVRLEVGGFIHNRDFNQDFMIASETNVNGSPAYFTKDGQTFLYRRDVKTKVWTICPRLDIEEPGRDLFQLARWGGQRGLAIQFQAQANNCTNCGLAFPATGGSGMFCRKCGTKRAQVSSWSEFNPITAEWEQAVDATCQAHFEDNRQPMTPPGEEVIEYIVNRMNFIDGKPLKGHEKGLCLFKEKNVDKPDKTKIVAWGTTVRGEYQSGWLKVTHENKDLFLPVVLRGREVLTVAQDMDPVRLAELKAIAAQEPADPRDIGPQLAD